VDTFKSYQFKKFNNRHLGIQLVAWTDGTRQGCAGQFTGCFGSDDPRILHKSANIRATATDGNCLARFFLLGPDSFTLKTMSCKVKLDLLCFGKVGFQMPEVGESLSL
jgi:hypothetical protein